MAIRLCAQGMVNRAHTDVWQWMVEDLPPEDRHLGPADMSKVGTPDSAPFPFAMEITRWDEGRGLAIRISRSWYFKGLWLDVELERYGWDKTRILLQSELRSAFNPLLRLGYGLFRRRVNQLLITIFAEERYEIETGQKVTDDNRAAVRLDDIDIIPCGRKT